MIAKIARALTKYLTPIVETQHGELNAHSHPDPTPQPSSTPIKEKQKEQGQPQSSQPPQDQDSKKNRTPLKLVKSAPSPKKPKPPKKETPFEVWSIREETQHQIPTQVGAQRYEFAAKSQKKGGKFKKGTILETEAG